MCAFVVLGFAFPHQTKRLAWGTSPKWPILCWVWRKTLTQSISLVFVCPAIWIAVWTMLWPLTKIFFMLVHPDTVWVKVEGQDQNSRPRDEKCGFVGLVS